MSNQTRISSLIKTPYSAEATNILAILERKHINMTKIKGYGNLGWCDYCSPTYLQAMNREDFPGREDFDSPCSFLVTARAKSMRETIIASALILGRERINNG